MEIPANKIMIIRRRNQNPREKLQRGTSFRGSSQFIQARLAHRLTTAASCIVFSGQRHPSQIRLRGEGTVFL